LRLRQRGRRVANKISGIHASIARRDRNRSLASDQKKETVENHGEGREKGSQESGEEGKTIQFKSRQVGRFPNLTAFSRRAERHSRCESPWLSESLLAGAREPDARDEEGAASYARIAGAGSRAMRSFAFRIPTSSHRGIHQKISPSGINITTINAMTHSIFRRPP
jgi:hypothetical protein